MKTKSESSKLHSVKPDIEILKNVLNTTVLLFTYLHTIIIMSYWATYAHLGPIINFEGLVPYLY